MPGKGFYIHTTSHMDIIRTMTIEKAEFRAVYYVEKLVIVFISPYK